METTSHAYTLRPYQAEASSRGLAFLRRRTGQTGGLIVSPTGSGKSLIIASIVSQLDGPAIVFQPSTEILDQNAEKLRAYGYEPAIFSASKGRKDVGTITLATIGSVRNHVEAFAGYPNAIVDECHLVSAKVDKKTGEPTSMYGQFLAASGARVIGLTATPYRLSHDGYGGSILKFLTRTRPRIFSELVHQTPIADLVRDGYWARLVYDQVPGVDRSKLRLNTTGADYTDASVQRLFDDIGFESLLARTVRGVLERGRKSVLVFTRFVREAQALAAELPGFAVVTGETPANERKSIITNFRAGRLPGIANVGVLATGFDYPELDTVVLARPTVSLALYYQNVWPRRAAASRESARARRRSGRPRRSVREGRGPRDRRRGEARRQLGGEGEGEGAHEHVFWRPRRAAGREGEGRAVEERAVSASARVGSDARRSVQPA